MTYTILNQAGNFDSWKEVHLDEIKTEKFNGSIGELLYENKEIKVWQIQLKPSERIPFRRHYNNYSCTSFTDGLLISRNVNGQIVLIRLHKGGNSFWQCEENELIRDIENIGENTVKITIVEEKVN